MYFLQGDHGEVVNIYVDMNLYKGESGEPGLQGPRVIN